MKKNIILFMLTFFGKFPCIITSLFWGIALFAPLVMFSEVHSLNSLIESMVWCLGAFMLGLSGLLGLKFFDSVIGKYIAKTPWNKKDYIYGLFAFAGCSIVFIYTLDKTAFLLAPPMIAANVAYFTRFKDINEK